MNRHTAHKIATMRAKLQEQNDELMHLEDLSIQCANSSDYVDDLAEMYADAWTVDGMDERRAARALSYAGFRTAYRC